MKKLSIIIPVYNTPKHLLEKCLESCKSNSDIETILIDDGSNIDYGEIIKKYKIKYIKTTNHGVSYARNLGINISEGEYITFLDSDDTIIILDKIIEILDKIDILITRNYVVKDTKRENHYEFNKSQLIDPILLKRDMFILESRKIESGDTVWAKFYRRDFLIKNGISFNANLKRGEDVIFNYEAYSRTNNIFYLNEFGYNYRMDNESITRSFDKIMDVTTFKLLQEFEILFKKLNIEDPNYPSYVFRLMIRLMRKYYVYLSEEEFNNKIDLLFNNVILDYYLNHIDVTKLDEYKQKLHELLLEKDKVKLYGYLREVCDKKLLKK